MTITREQATEIAIRCAKAKPNHSYITDPFNPHEWVIDAIMQASSPSWMDASIPPNVPKGKDAYFWIAVRRKDRDKVVTFPAVYANAYPLCSEDPEDAQGDHWSQVSVDYDEVGADILATGWYDIKESAEYDSEYSPVCNKGDVILAWHRGPEFQA